MTGSRFDKAFRIARNAKAFLSPEADGTVPDTEQQEEQAEKPKKARRRKREQKAKLRSKRRELSQITEELHVAKRRGERSERFEQVKRTKKKKQEIFRLKNELRAAERGTEGEPGALPDFVVIGAPKCGTTFFYRLLTKHPHVEPSAFKELHFFDLLFKEGIEWCRQCFLPPKLKDGRETRIKSKRSKRPWKPASMVRTRDFCPSASTWTISCAGPSSSPKSRCSC